MNSGPVALKYPNSAHIIILVEHNDKVQHCNSSLHHLWS